MPSLYIIAVPFLIVFELIMINNEALGEFLSANPAREDITLPVGV